MMTPRIVALLLALGVSHLSAQGIATPAQTPAAPPPATQTQPPAPARPSGPVSADYLIGAGDLLRITVYGEPLLSGQFRVDNEGTFPFQYLDRVKAEGLTASAVE